MTILKIKKNQRWKKLSQNTKTKIKTKKTLISLKNIYEKIDSQMKRSLNLFSWQFWSYNFWFIRNNMNVINESIATTTIH